MSGSGRFLIHLSVPGGEHTHGVVERFTGTWPPFVSRRQLPGKELVETAIDVFLNAQIVFGFEFVAAGAQHVLNLFRTPWRGELAADVVGIVRWKRILIRRDQKSARRIVCARQFVERDVAVPLVGSRCASTGTSPA